MKKILISLVFLFIAVSAYCFPKHIEEDLQVFKTYMEQCYVAYDENVKLGFDIDETIKQIKNYYKKDLKYVKKNKIDRKEDDILAFAITFILRENLKIKDVHLNLLFSDGAYRVFIRDDNSFSPLYFEKIGEEFFLLEDFNSEIKKGIKYTDDVNNLKKVIYKNQEAYQYILVTTNVNIETVAINLNHTNYEIPVKENTRFKNSENKKQINSIRTKDTFYMSVGKCLNYYAEENNEYREHLASIVDEFQKRPEYSNIIIDLRSNTGGISFSENLLPYLYYFDEKVKILTFNNNLRLAEEGLKTLHSTEFLKKLYEQREKEGYPETSLKTIQRDYEKTVQEGGRYYKEWSEYPISKLVQEKNSAFKGKTYVLVDKKTSSAAEKVIAHTFLIDEDRVELIGENTNGCLDFGGVYNYELPNTKIEISLCINAYKDTGLLSKNPNWHGDTKGFYPDYWATNENVLDTLVYLTKDEELRTVLADLDKGIQ